MATVERWRADEAAADPAYARTTVTSAEVCVIPSALVGRFVWIGAEGQDVAVRFGESDSVTVDITATSSRDGGTLVLTAAGTEPHVWLPAGSVVRVRLRGDWTHLAHVSGTAGGVFRIGLRQGEYGAEE